MNKIVAYRKLLNVTKDATLKELKTIYRNSMKDFHPDKFTDTTEKSRSRRKKYRYN
jgi:DnaJ-class molecular chaperone